MAELLPPGRDLARHNRHVLAARAGWPDGAVAQCEMVEAYHPDWYPMWWRGGDAWRPAPGFYALRWDPERGDRPLYGVTCAELACAIDEWRQVEAAKPEWPRPHFS